MSVNNPKGINQYSKGMPNPKSLGAKLAKTKSGRMANTVEGIQRYLTDVVKGTASMARNRRVFKPKFDINDKGVKTPLSPQETIKATRKDLAFHIKHLRKIGRRDLNAGKSAPATTRSLMA